MAGEHAARPAANFGYKLPGIAGLNITGFKTTFFKVGARGEQRYMTFDFIAQASTTEITFLNW